MGLIDLAWGMPSSRALPVSEVREAILETQERVLLGALQYRPPQGCSETLAAVARWARDNGIAAGTVALSEVLFAQGAQDALTTIAQTYINGGVVIVPCPTYYQAARLFSCYAMELIPIPLLTDGPDRRLLAAALERGAQLGCSRPVIYAIPTNDNPRGLTWSLECRLQVVRLAEAYGAWIIEDDPCRLLSLDDLDVPPTLYSLSPGGRVLHVCSLSKVFFPGARGAFVLGRTQAIDRLVRHREITHSACNPFSELLYRSLLRQDVTESLLVRIRRLYRELRDSMIEAIVHRLPPATSFIRPRGGLFIWMDHIPGVGDAARLAQVAARYGVRIMPGAQCLGARSAVRICYSGNPVSANTEAIRRLAVALGQLRAQT